jgi:hypothetical protein
MDIETQNSHRITITSATEGGLHHSYLDVSGTSAEAVEMVKIALDERRERGDEVEDITITIDGPQPQPYIDALGSLD